MGRRAPDPRPPIEVVGAEPDFTSVQRVSTGPGRPSGGRGRALALGVGVVGLLLGGLALGGADDEPSASAKREERDNRERKEIKPSSTVTTRPRSTTTRPPTTTTTIPVGPVFGQPVGASLLVFGNGHWRLVDLDTGVRRDLTLPTDDPYAARVVTGGVVVVSPAQHTAFFYDLLGGGETPSPVELGRADQVLAAGQPDRIWLVESGGVFEGDPQAATTKARLVDLSGRVLRSFELPGTFVTAGVSQGLVLTRGGRVYLADETGIVAIATGYVMGATDDAVVLVACDDRADCALTLQPIDGGRPAELLRFPGIEETGFDMILSPDGDFGVYSYGNERRDAPALWLFAASGRPLGTFDISATAAGSLPPEAFGLLPRWLPDDLGLLVPRGVRTEWARLRDGTWQPELLPSLEGLAMDVAFVIQP